jgi:Na+/H+ antiporter NhaC
LGIFSGALLTTGFDLPRAVGETLEIHLWKTVIDEGKLRVFAFTLLMGAMVGVLNRSGGMEGIVNLAVPWARGRRGGQFTGWLLGMLIFFDDYANTVLLGNTLRPLCDRLRISREKLAYVVDSTAAPVAALALVSTWIAVEIAYIQDGIDHVRSGGVQVAGPDRFDATSSNADAGAAPVSDVHSAAGRLRALDLFVATIPYRFYLHGTLLLVLLIALTGRDFGPMLRAERRVLSGERPAWAALESGADDPTAAAADTPARWYNAALPVSVTVASIVWLLYSSGTAALADTATAIGGLAEASAEATVARSSWRDIVGAADAGYALMWGSLAGLMCAVALVRGQGLLSTRQLYEAAGAGARLMLPALAILWFASALSRMTSGEPLSTGEFLAQLLGGRLSPALMPTVVFILASAVSFSTGTSFGTMGILVPMVVPMVCGVLASGGKPIEPGDPILLATVGSVLAGAIFGDHCSPISDTTILSSQASGCDHTAHVWTQLPYAVLAAAVAITCGTLPVGLGVPVVWCLAACASALAVAVYLFGTLVTKPPICQQREDHGRL